ncbi:ATP binding protein, putative, partial [Fagus crenata]
SDTERLQSLTEKQAQQITENTQYIKELEDRERVLVQNVIIYFIKKLKIFWCIPGAYLVISDIIAFNCYKVEELLMEIKETEAEVARWKEACELEVEAGKKEMGERDKVVAILKQELEKTRSALDISNGKLKLKEELAAAAMAAQEAAERSLQLADSRAAGLRERIEELTRQLEESESRERSRHKIRHICWPWRIFKANPANSASSTVQNVRRMLPEMQALLHNSA